MGYVVAASRKLFVYLLPFPVLQCGTVSLPACTLPHREAAEVSEAERPSGATGPPVSHLSEGLTARALASDCC